MLEPLDKVVTGMMIDSAMTALSGAGGPAAAVTAGIASAAMFALSNAMQHRAAGTVPPSVKRPLAVLVHLARQPMWRIATCISFCALVLHAVALQLGSIALVQPLMLVGVVLAVPVRSALEHKTPQWSEVRAVGVTVLGLAAFIVSADPRPSGQPADFPAASAFVVGCVVVGLCLVRVSRITRRPGAAARQAAVLGVGAGVMFGATAGLLKLVGTAAASDAPTAMLLPVLAALVCAGLLGTAMNQRAYQLAPISCSMPLVNVVDIMVAVLFGVAVFGELPGHSATHLTVQLTALVCISIGLRLITSLPARVVEAARVVDAAGVVGATQVLSPAGQLR